MSEGRTRKRTCPRCEVEYDALSDSLFVHKPSYEVCTSCSVKEEQAKLKADMAERRALRAKGQARRAEAQEARDQRKKRRKAKRELEKERAREEVKAERKAARLARSKASKINVAQRELAIRKLSQMHLLPFVLRMEGGDYLPGWVHKDICQRLEKFEQDILAKRSPRLMLQMPPRHGKSQLASVNFPAWFLGRNPKLEIISATYSGTLAKEFSKKVRARMREPNYSTVFPRASLSRESQNIDGWNTAAGGAYVPAGVDGGITGKGAHCLIIDDPVKNAEEAESATQREAVKNWYSSTAYTRLAPGGGVLIIQTRWHDDDLSGWLEHKMHEGDGDKWEIIRYPAVAKQKERYREKGEALHPERYDLKALRRIERAVGPRVWDALYQQYPVAEDGTYFTKEMINYYTGSPPKRMHNYTCWDLAIGKAERNDYTAGVTIGLDAEDNIWVLDVRRGRWDSFQIVEQMLDVYREYLPMTVGVERGQLSLAVGPYLEQRIAEERLYTMYVKDLSPGRRDKEARARAIQGRMRQGKVFFPKDAPFMGELRDEMLKFPLGVNDDMVDALAYIGLLLQDMSPPPELRAPDPAASGWRKRLRTQLTVSSPSRKNAMRA